VAQEALGSIRTVTAFGGQTKEEKRLGEKKNNKNLIQVLI
jgi:hypothetical protein